MDKDDVADDDLLDLGYRGRGRPKLPNELRRREKLIISLTADEMRDMIHAAADSQGGPQRIQDWARSVLAAAAASSNDKRK